MKPLEKCKFCHGTGTIWSGKQGKSPKVCPVCKGKTKV